MKNFRINELMRTNFSICLYFTYIMLLLYVLYRHNQSCSFIYTLDVLIKHRIGTLSYWRYINRSNKLFSKKYEKFLQLHKANFSSGLYHTNTFMASNRFFIQTYSIFCNTSFRCICMP